MLEAANEVLRIPTLFLFVKFHAQKWYTTAMAESPNTYRPHQEEEFDSVDTGEQQVNETNEVDKLFNIGGYAFTAALFLTIAAKASDGNRSDVLFLLAIAAGGVGIGAFAETSAKARKTIATLYTQKKEYQEQRLKDKETIDDLRRKIASYGLDESQEDHYVEE